MKKEDLFRIIQDFLRNPPTIIWGSGATIPFGLPSMKDLVAKLKDTIPGLNEKKNLEEAISEIDDDNKFKKIKNIIWGTIYKSDVNFMKELCNDKNKGKPIKEMIKKFVEPHPQVLNIITTNYDRVLEYVLAINKFYFSDGFSGWNLSIFDEKRFENKNIVNLIKVHGSLNWFENNGEILFISNGELLLNSLENSKITITNSSLNPLIIAPSKRKFQEASHEPFRTLIQKSDEILNNSKSFFVVGFGFNDEHLTPKIDSRIKDGIPIVVITKKATDSCLEKLKLASKYVLIEEGDIGGSKILLKNDKTKENENFSINSSIWKLETFLEEVI